MVRRALLSGAGVVGGLAGLVVTAAPVAAAPVADYEMPFPCAQQWTGKTRSNHSPSSRAIDWNRVDDVNDPVVAAAPGVVSTADSVDNSGYGKYVVIDHGNNEKSLYAHLNAVYVATGQRIDQGSELGIVGSTGNSTGPHLHFEERSGSDVVTPYFHRTKFVFGSTLASQNCVDVPIAGDWNGDDVGQVGVFRRAGKATFRMYRPDGSTIVRTHGVNTDEPVIGDWDGNGNANIGVRAPATSTFSLRVGKTVTTVVFGAPADRPVAGDWNGNGTWEVGVRRAGTGTFSLRGAGGRVTNVVLGDADDLPVTGDWNGDGRTDLGVFDPSTATWQLRYVDGNGTAWTASVAFGTRGDLPVTADWDGNGRTDLGTWTPTTATFNQRLAASPTTSTRRVTSLRFGVPR